MTNPKTTILALAAALAFAAAPAFAEGDAGNGAKLFKRKCFVCHTIEQGAKNKVGPNLWAVFGNKPGMAEGYKYSKSYLAAAEKGLVWDDKAIDAYMIDPRKFIREASGDPKGKSKMTVKIKKDTERVDIIAYVKTQK
ncbi:MAG: c-type cytochrome [Rhodospirillales bacterium]|jgi:cytochrome c|nr:c-type cytochrome [Rhodospirillales bacterium]